MSFEKHVNSVHVSSDSSYDNTLNTMLQMTSHYATDLLKPEYEYALSKFTKDTVKKAFDCMYSVTRKEPGSTLYFVNSKI